MFDRTQLTAKPLNIHYYRDVLTQKNISNLLIDECELLYLEEDVACKANTYTYNDSGVTIYPVEYYANTQFGFLRTAMSIVGKNKYDFFAKQNNAISGSVPLTDIQQKQSHINDSFMLEVQLTYPKYLKYLILRICNRFEADPGMTHYELNSMLVNVGVSNILYALDKILNAEVSVTYWYSDNDSSIGKQYTYSPNENKRFLACGGTTSWDEETSPSKNYFRWNVVFPEIVELYKEIKQKQGRGDAVYILPYTKTGVDIHANIYVDDSTPDMSSVFENIWDSLIYFFGLLKNIEDIKYLSEIVSIIQSSDVNILKICTINEVPYSGTYVLQPLSEEDTIYRTDTSESSIKDFYRFLKFEPETDIQPKTNLGQSLVLGTVCIRLQKMSALEKTVYHFERSCFKIDTTLAYKIRQVN